ncbi:tetratricopeptide repeat protein [Kangiella sp.]|uniref:tetratricopeptide repeat protein n=1 Tax=Kangiella sp. TaxID=1920245 RepID=UPI001997C9F0|nr:tetratricopeptide repeat protein [Kangiella sp.]MBD3653037.1 sel1 repeat family protein [Kangiella sp.]
MKKLSNSYHFILFGLMALLLTACGASPEDLKRCEQHYQAKSYKVAEQYCKKGAKSGDETAQYLYAMMLYRGLGVEVDTDEASKWMKRSAEQGYQKAVFHKAIYYLTTKDKDVSMEQKETALQTMQGFAEQGDKVAQYWMGNTFYFGYIDGRKSYNEAVYWYQQAAEQGSYQAMNNLAWLKVVSQGSELFDPEQGLELSLRVIKKYPENHGYLDTLAAAYAANQQFEQAVATQLKVIELASHDDCEKCDKLVDYYQGRLQLYLNKKPVVKTLEN